LNNGLNKQSSREDLDDVERVTDLYKGIGESYDRIDDFLLCHVDKELDRILLDFIGSLEQKEQLKVLDIGCGSGFQTLLFARKGLHTVGIDLSKELIDEAIKKAKSEKIEDRVKFSIADATDLPFRDESFDVICCCGSVLSYIPDYKIAVSEMSRVLKQGGKIIIDVDHKWNFNSIHMLIDSLTGNHMGYDVPLPEAIKSFRDYRSGFVDEYPIINADGNSELHRLWFYTFSELEEPLKKNQVKIEKIWGIHIFTSLIPYS
jgi:ubiquinone/menaquinone biosynthesis C-methylase UbiE